MFKKKLQDCSSRKHCSKQISVLTEILILETYSEIKTLCIVDTTAYSEPFLIVTLSNLPIQSQEGFIGGESN